ncbi:MAG: hypothetical protein JXB49_24070 [Bacteroidales bacterium]|nr:hypothetical protein [Bacteroidales bacterium]
MKNLFYFGILLRMLLSGCDNILTRQRNEEGNVTKEEFSALEKSLIKKDELNLQFRYLNTEQEISYRNYMSACEHWKTEVLNRFSELFVYELTRESHGALVNN